MGRINGLNAFSPAEFQDNVTIPPVVVTALTQGGDALETAVSIENVEEITLYWPANFFEFEFAALSYVNPEGNEYAYKLEGFDEDWNRVGSRPYGRYTNLPGGSYTLRLIGSNNDGIWNEDGATVKVTVVPLVSRAKVLGTLAVIARGQRDFSEQDIKLLTSIGDQIGVAVENAQLYEQAQQAAVMEERQRLARELHDSVTQSLHGSTLMAEAAQRIAATGDLERTRGYLARRDFTTGVEGDALVGV